MTLRHGTDYELVRSSGEYRQCNELLKEHDIPYTGRLSFPTISATRDGELIGLISTIPGKKMIIAGPIFINTKKPIFVGKRLMQAYEGVLKLAGVKQYYFYINTDNESFLGIVRGFDDDVVQEVNRTESEAWYKRLI